MLITTFFYLRHKVQINLDLKRYLTPIALFFFSLLTGYGSDLASDYSLVIDAYKNNDYEQTKIIGNEVLDKAKEQQDYYHLTKLYYILGYVSEMTDDFGNAIIYYLEGCRMGLLCEDLSIKPSVISMHKNLETILADYKHFDLAKQFIKDGIELSITYKSEEQVISLTSNLIYILIQEEKYDEVLVTIDSLRSNFELDYNTQIQLKNKEGIAHMNLNNLKDAEACYQFILDNDPSSDSKMYAFALHNLALIELKKEKTNLAINYLNQAITYSLEKKLNFRVFRGRQQLGELYLSNNQLNLALYQFLNAAEIIETSYTNNAETYSIYQWISTTYEQQGNIALALEYKEKYSEKLEEYIAQQKEITELDKKYNIQLLTDRYYDLLAADMEQKETERLAKFGIGGTASFFLIILSIMVYRQRRTKVLLAREINELHLTSEV